MNPLRLQATFYRTYETLDLTLDDGITGIVGANGAGKSSIVDAIELALFGPASRSLAPYVTDGADDDLEMTLTFEHEGETYRVRRGYTVAGRGRSTLDFEQADPIAMTTGWDSLTADSLQATQTLVEQTIGLTRTIYRASVFLAQGDAACFTDAPAGERKRILSDILALDVWAELLELARRDRRTAEQQLDQLDGETKALRETAERKPEVAEEVHFASVSVDEHRSAADAAEGALEHAALAVQAAERADLSRQAVTAEVARARAERDRLVALETASVAAFRNRGKALEELAALVTPERLAELEREEQALRERAAREDAALAAHDAARRERDLRVAQRNAVEAQARDLRAKATVERETAQRLVDAGPGVEHCRECHQTLGQEALTSSIAAMRTQADDLEAAAADRDAQAAEIEVAELPASPERDDLLGETLLIVQERLRKARADQETRAGLTERVAALSRTIEDGEGLAGQLADAHQVLAGHERDLAALPATVDVDGLRVRAVAAKEKLDQARASLTAAGERRARADQELERIDEAIAKLAATDEQRASFLADVDLASTLERAYGRDGIPALLIENFGIPHIEREANAILRQLPTTDGTTFQVELATQRELKGGGTSEALDILISDGTHVRTYETYSGGERARLNFALRVGLALLIANRRGAQTDVLIVDEIEHLDDAGQTALVDVLQGLAGRFRKILTVSHASVLRDAFDAQLTIEKNDGRSTVAGQLEAVAA